MWSNDHKKVVGLYWGSIVLYLVVAGWILFLAGCVDGEPFAPEMCEFTAEVDSLRSPLFSWKACALPVIELEVQRDTVTG